MIKRLRLYTPYALQRRFHALCWKARFSVVAWARQMGKSTAALNHMARTAWENPGRTYWFISPTYDQARGQWRRLMAMLFPCREVIASSTQTELRVLLINGSQIVFKSGDRPNNLLGTALHGVVIDEVRDQEPWLWSRVIRPMLNTTKGWAIFISTPNGFDTFWELFETARADTSGEWAHMQAPATECPLYPPGEIESLRRTMSEPEFAQEIEAEFRDLTSGKAYHAYGQHNEREDSPFAVGMYASAHLPVLVGMDFNLSPMSWAIGQHRERNIHWSDELYLTNSHTQQAATALCDMLDERYAFAKQTGLIIIGDATGKALQRSSNKTDYDIALNTFRMRGYLVTNRTPESNPAVSDRVNTVNASLRSADGTVSQTLSPTRCKKLREDFQRVLWKQNSQGHVLDSGPRKLLGHMSDAAGYPTCIISPIKRMGQTSRLSVIVR